MLAIWFNSLYALLVIKTRQHFFFSGHCQAMAPAWKEAAANYAGPVPWPAIETKYSKMSCLIGSLVSMFYYSSNLGMID